MATYYHGGSEIQATNTPSGDNLQTLYLMNPNNNNYISHPPYHEPQNNNQHNNNQTPPNMFLHNAPTPSQQLIGIPLTGSLSFSSGNVVQDHQPHHHQIYNNPLEPTTMEGAFHHQQVVASPRGLSLSLSSREQNHHPMAMVGGDGGRKEEERMAVTVAVGSNNGVVLKSKYMKAAQELLDEVVNVGEINKVLVKGECGGGNNKEKGKMVNDLGGSGGDGGSGGGDGGSKKLGEQLSVAQRQEIQMKKAKLLNMLDEVEQRYNQYHIQMQGVVSSLEQAAGIGCAKSYTSLALHTISRQFRNLKDSITSQITATNKSLGEEDGKATEGSRLKLVDHQFRQQQALQQIGMMQHNPWRPQRGLPERAVSVLRAWLFEHFLHPYPKDSDKHMLAKQTGLTRGQVSNWFINARVRLWKPMVEEMYLEEIKAQDPKGGNSDDNTTITTTTTANDNSPTSYDAHKSQSTPQFQLQHHHQQQQNDSIGNDPVSSSGFTLIGSSSNMESFMGRSLKKNRSSICSDIDNSRSNLPSMDMDMKFKQPHDQIQHLQTSREQIHSPLMSDDHNRLGFNPYIVQDIGRFNPAGTQHFHGNGSVSLTLGLPPSETLSSLNHHHNFIPNQGMQLGSRRFGDNTGGSQVEFGDNINNGYDGMDLQSRKRYAAQILHDFVA